MGAAQRTDRADGLAMAGSYVHQHVLPEVAGGRSTEQTSEVNSWSSGMHVWRFVHRQCQSVACAYMGTELLFILKY